MRCSLHPEARRDLQEAVDHYREQAGIALARSLLDELDRAIALLLRHPRLGAIWRHGKRRLLLRRFPYSLIYTVADDEIRVFAVAHQARRPGYWRGRS